MPRSRIRFFRIFRSFFFLPRGSWPFGSSKIGPRPTRDVSVMAFGVAQRLADGRIARST